MKNWTQTGPYTKSSRRTLNTAEITEISNTVQRDKHVWEDIRFEVATLLFSRSKNN